MESVKNYYQTCIVVIIHQTSIDRLKHLDIKPKTNKYNAYGNSFAKCHPMAHIQHPQQTKTWKTSTNILGNDKGDKFVKVGSIGNGPIPSHRTHDPHWLSQLATFIELDGSICNLRHHIEKEYQSHVISYATNHFPHANK